MSVEQSEFRYALKHFASGVTVVTTQHRDQLYGTTVSSFSSLSLNPPLILICMDLGSTTHTAIVKSGVFGVNILSEQGELASSQFARRSADKFANINYHLGRLEVPLLEDTLATLECRVNTIYPGGDHVIIIGEVIATHVVADKQPLLYYCSQYHQLKDGLPVLS